MPRRVPPCDQFSATLYIFGQLEASASSGRAGPRLWAFYSWILVFGRFLGVLLLGVLLLGILSLDPRSWRLF
jgi:hypothetical protein